MQDTKTSDSRIKKGNKKAPRARTSPSAENGRTGSNGSSKTGSDVAARGGIGFHLLTRSLRSYTTFEFELQSADSRWKEILSTVSTEAKQLQLIEDLHAIWRAQPKNKEAKEPSWKGTEEPIVLILWFLRRLGPLAEGNRWHIDTWREAEKLRYRFVVFKDYPSYFVKTQQEYLPLDFLPALKERDLPLHDLVIDVLALVSKHNSIPLWDEDGDFSVALTTLKTVPPNGYAGQALIRQHFDYTEGYAAEYLSLLKARRETVDFDTLHRSIERYHDKSYRQGHLKIWLRDGLKLAMRGQNIHPFSYLPNYNNRKGLAPERLYKIVWSLHKNDVVCKMAYKIINKDESKAFHRPVMFTIAHPGEEIKPVKIDSFPEYLAEFLGNGVRFFTSPYRDYFYKEGLSLNITPTETLLEIFETEDLQTQLSI